MAQATFLFIINPHSGTTDKSELQGLIEEICDKYNAVYAIYTTSGNNDHEKIKQEVANRQPKTVIACGGDGTVNLVAKVLMDSQVKLGIIPLGSANGLANELEIPEDIEESLEIIFKSDSKPLDVLLINNEHISLHLSDVGFNAKMIRDFEKSGERGKLSYAKSFFNSLREKQSTEFTVTLNNHSFDVTAEMIVFANASSYGTGAIINPESAMDDGLFEVIVFKPIPLSDLVSLTFSSFFGDINNSEFVDIYRTDAAKILCHTKELLQIDGELKGDVTEIDVKIVKGAINLIRP